MSGMNQKTAVIYVRVSDPTQVENFSLDSQEASCRKKAAELGPTEIKVFREEGISAKTIEARPQLQEAILYCKNKKNNVGVFIVYSFSRLSRSTLDFLTIRGYFKKAGISLVSIVEPSGDNPENELISTIISSINQFDNEIKARVVKANMKARFMQGFPLGKAKLGYIMGIVEGKSCPVPQEPLFSVVQTMWRRIANERLSLRQVQRELVKLGHKEYPIQTLSGVFLSKFYCGTLESETYGEIQGKHQPMIDEATFYQVREVLIGRKPHEQERHHLREDFPLRGTLICEFCGLHLTGSWSKGCYEKYAYYYCGSRGKHKIISINADKTKTRYLDLLSTISPKPNRMQLLSELIIEQYETRVKQQGFISTDVQGEINKLAAMRKELGKKHLTGIYTDQDYLDLRDDLDGQIAKKYALMNSKKLIEVDIHKVMEFVSEYFSHLDRAWNRAGLLGKHAISSSIFPRGILCLKDELRTIEIERIYEQTKIFSDQIIVSTP